MRSETRPRLCEVIFLKRLEVIFLKRLEKAFVPFCGAESLLK
jgi:hypothetical protein